MKGRKCHILLLFNEIQKIQNIDIRKTYALKTRMRIQMWMSKKCGTTADADIRFILNQNTNLNKFNLTYP